MLGMGGLLTEVQHNVPVVHVIFADARSTSWTSTRRRRDRDVNGFTLSLATQVTETLVPTCGFCGPAGEGRASPQRRAARKLLTKPARSTGRSPCTEWPAPCTRSTRRVG